MFCARSTQFSPDTQRPKSFTHRNSRTLYVCMCSSAGVTPTIEIHPSIHLQCTLLFQCSGSQHWVKMNWRHKCDRRWHGHHGWLRWSVLLKFNNQILWMRINTVLASRNPNTHPPGCFVPHGVAKVRFCLVTLSVPRSSHHTSVASSQLSFVPLHKTFTWHSRKPNYCLCPTRIGQLNCI